MFYFVAKTEDLTGHSLRNLESSLYENAQEAGDGGVAKEFSTETCGQRLLLIQEKPDISS